MLKIIGLALSVYLAIFFALVVPLHHHADLNSRDDCSICAVSHQPFSLDNNVTINISLVFVFMIFLPCLLFSNREITQLYLRSPTVF